MTTQLDLVKARRKIVTLEAELAQSNRQSIERLVECNNSRYAISDARMAAQLAAEELRAECLKTKSLEAYKNTMQVLVVIISIGFLVALVL